MAQKNSNLYEVSFICEGAAPGQTDILRGILASQGVKPHDIVETQLASEQRLCVYFTVSDKARSFMAKVKKVPLRNIRISSKVIKSRDWQTVWKEEFRPFVLTKRFEIVPYQYRKSHRSGDYEPVYIDTICAFGTGLHATTRFMSGFIEGCSGKFDSFLDIGTGTGLLAIIALKCGATDVTAIDLRRDIIDIANMNFRENGYSQQKARAINFQKYHSKKKFDFVAANLVTVDLLTFRHQLINLVGQGKYLAVSGISLSHYAEFRQAFDRLPLRCLKIKKGEGWSALLFQKE
ncbi:MAG: 50S ribosomal protein L11 methyltransferase [Candidatus Omnitrophica bacterium]|nr:50S ribosomal protein L11 methyltransferase [Candidatus Omnitrophota bacterium]